MDITKNIGLKIRALRKQKGLSQAKLAEMIDRSTEAVSNLERGTNLPTIEILVRLGQQPDTPVHYFFDCYIMYSSRSLDLTAFRNAGLSNVRPI